MKVFLNQIEINKDIFLTNDGLNFGRFSDKPTQTIELHFSKSEIIDLLEKEYNKVRDEIKQDDFLYKDESDFTATNYCSFSVLIEHKDDFEQIMKTYLKHNLLAKQFDVSGNKKYVINSIDSIQIQNSTIIFKGRVFELQN